MWALWVPVLGHELTTSTTTGVLSPQDYTGVSCILALSSGHVRDMVGTGWWGGCCGGQGTVVSSLEATRNLSTLEMAFLM